MNANRMDMIIMPPMHATVTRNIRERLASLYPVSYALIDADVAVMVSIANMITKIVLKKMGNQICQKACFLCLVICSS